jgi:hypothetical protein
VVGIVELELAYQCRRADTAMTLLLIPSSSEIKANIRILPENVSLVTVGTYKPGVPVHLVNWLAVSTVIRTHAAVRAIIPLPSLTATGPGRLAD